MDTDELEQDELYGFIFITRHYAHGFTCLIIPCSNIRTHKHMYDLHTEGDHVMSCDP